MCGINTAGKRVYRRVLITLCFIQTLTASENQIDMTEQFLFQQRQTRVSAFERRQLVHAIVYRSDWTEVIGETERHRRVVPEHVVVNLVIEEQLARHLFHDGIDRYFASQSFRQVRHNYAQSRFCFAHHQTHGAVTEYRFFYIEDSTTFSGTAQKMLRTLVDKIPAQV